MVVRKETIKDANSEDTAQDLFCDLLSTYVWSQFIWSGLLDTDQITTCISLQK